MPSVRRIIVGVHGSAGSLQALRFAADEARHRAVPLVDFPGPLPRDMRYAYTVQEAAIVGLPDQKWGEAPHAFIVLRDGASATQEEMIAFARGRLAHFKAPRGVTFVAELPKTATGKIQKYVLRGSAASVASPQAAAGQPD